MIQTANTKDMYYTCTNYLDNINLVINQSKTVAQENSFDAWGRSRNVNTWSHTNVTNPTLLQRGFTGHVRETRFLNKNHSRTIPIFGKHLDDFGLINMNVPIKQAQSHARMSYAEREVQRGVASTRLYDQLIGPR